MEVRPYDILVYGASGYTGKFVAAEMMRTCAGKKMAIAGRNETKLHQVFDFIRQELGDDVDVSGIGVVIADNADESSINAMCSSTHMLVNCVGPYRWFGEQVVRNCVATTTNYVDVSGEPEFLQMCQIRYHEEALEKGIHIVGACGFDSVPADVGLEFLREKFPGELTSADSYIKIHGPGKGNYGTYNTIIQSVAGKSNLKAQHEAIFKGKKLPYNGEKIKYKGITFEKSVGKWIVPFKGADPSVVRRTQLYESSVHNKTPIQYGVYLTLVSFLQLIGLIIFGINIFLFTRFQLGIKLLQRFPRIFSFGIFSKEGPSREDVSKTGFSVIFHGRGYSVDDESGEPKKPLHGPPDVRMDMKFVGPDLGYVFTSMSVVACARTLMDDVLVNAGGVLTPGSAFKGSKLIERLMERGVKIECSSPSS